MNDLEMIRGFRADLGTELGPGQLEPAWLAVRERITFGPDLSVGRPGRLRRRPVSILIAAAALIALLVALPAILPPGAPGSANRAGAVVSFSRDGRFIVAVIEDLNADSEALRQAFAQQGLDITLHLVPVSPSLVGTFPSFEFLDEGTQKGPAIETLASDDPTCTTASESTCTIGLRVPVGFQGHAEFFLGRPANPGEKYDLTNDGYAAGEALHCTGLYGMTVQAALPVLSDRGVTPIWRSTDQSIDTGDGIDPSIIADQYVTDASAYAPGEVFIWVTPDQPSPLPPSDYLRRRDQGC